MTTKLNLSETLVQALEREGITSIYEIEDLIEALRKLAKNQPDVFEPVFHAGDKMLMELALMGED